MRLRFFSAEQLSFVPNFHTLKLRISFDFKFFRIRVGWTRFEESTKEAK